MCVDNNFDALQAIKKLDDLLLAPCGVTEQEPSLKPIGGLQPALCDLMSNYWPFRPEAFRLVINVHFVHPPLFNMLIHSLRPGGYMYCETFGGQGLNYLSLPEAGRFRSVLENWLDFTFYQERPVGPLGQKVSVKFFGQKRINRSPIDI